MLKVSCGWLLALSPSLLADGPSDNVPDKVRPVPPPGIELSLSDREELEKGLGTLLSSLERLRKETDPFVVAHLPDVEIYFKAVANALAYHEFFNKDEI